MAFTLINTETGSEIEVVEGLKAITGVKESYQIYGVYDIIIKIEAETLQDLKEIVLRVRDLKKIRSMFTLMCI